MRLGAAAAIGFAAMLLVLGPSLATAEPAQADPFRDREDRAALLIARARVNAGMLPLARSAALDRAAAGHAEDMAAHGYMEHEGLDGSTPASRAAVEGYQTPPGSGWLVVEAISAMGDEPQGPVNWWLSDGLHRRVLLRSTWREMGIGYAPGGPYGRFWVALFGCRPNVLPPVLLDGTLSIPDETCSGGGGPDVFGSVAQVRVAETQTDAPWQPYVPAQPWPAGKAAMVDLQDSRGHEQWVAATDPTGSPAEPPQ